MIMTSFNVVKHFDVIKHIRSGLIPCCVHTAFDSFSLQQLEETLGNCVVMAVPSTTHTLLQIVRLEKALPIIATEYDACRMSLLIHAGRHTPCDSHTQNRFQARIV